jgi:3-deoxy-D-arabino-heptulosonate 7-phosphate (DAHP) synthase
MYNLLLVFFIEVETIKRVILGSKNMNKHVQVGSVKIGSGMPLVLISGPCVIENEKVTAWKLPIS